METMDIQRSILTYIGNNSEGSRSLATQRQIAEAIGVTKRTVNYHVDQLIQAGKMWRDKGSRTFGVSGVAVSLEDLDLDDSESSVLVADLAVGGGSYLDPAADPVDSDSAGRWFDRHSMQDVFFFVLMAAQTVHTFKFVCHLSGGDSLSLVYALCTCIGMDYLLYDLVVRGERNLVEGLKGFYILANVYAMNINRLSGVDWSWGVDSFVLLGQVLLTLVVSVYVVSMIHNVAVVKWRGNRGV